MVNTVSLVDLFILFKNQQMWQSIDIINRYRSRYRYRPILTHEETHQYKWMPKDKPNFVADKFLCQGFPGSVWLNRILGIFKARTLFLKEIYKKIVYF